MKTTITAKNMVVSEGIRKRVEKKTSTMSRYLRADTEMFVRMIREKNDRRVVEITVPMNGVTLRAEASADDNLFLAIDQALAKLERQIHRHKNKLAKRLSEDAFQPTEMEFIEEDIKDEHRPKVVRLKQFPIRPMSVEDAVMQMELLGHAFFVFVNAETGCTNVLYLRKDGDLGLMEPEA